jgi:hypothetical protein
MVGIHLALLFLTIQAGPEAPAHAGESSGEEEGIVFLGLGLIGRSLGNV